MKIGKSKKKIDICSHSNSRLYFDLNRNTKLYKTKIFEYEYYILEYFKIEVIDSQIHLTKLVF